MTRTAPNAAKGISKTVFELSVGAGTRLEHALSAFQFEPIRRRGLEDDLITRSVCFGDVFKLRHAVTGGYLVMDANIRGGRGAAETRRVLLASETDLQDADENLACFKLLPGGPEPRPALGSPITEGAACLLANAARPLRLCAARSGVVFAELPPMNDADHGGDAAAARATHRAFWFQVRLLAPADHEELLLVAALRRVPHVYNAVCRELAGRGADSLSDAAERRVREALEGVTRAVDACFAALGGKHRTGGGGDIMSDPPVPSMQTQCRTAGTLDDLVNMAIMPINAGVDVASHHGGRSWSDPAFDRFLAPVHRKMLATLGRMILGNRASEAHFGAGSVLVRRGEIMRGLRVNQRSDKAQAKRRPWVMLREALKRDEYARKHASRNSKAHQAAWMGKKPFLFKKPMAFVEAISLQAGHRLGAERVLRTLFISEDILGDDTVANAALVRRFCDFALKQHGPRPEFLNVLASLCSFEWEGSLRTMLRTQEICGEALFNAKVAGGAGGGDVASHLFLAISASELKDARDPRFPKEVHISWNADPKEFDYDAPAQLFHDAYSPKLFFRDGLKEVLWPGAPPRAEPRPAIEAYALSEQLQPVVKVRRADGYEWIRDDDVEGDEKIKTGAVWLRGDAELDTLQAELKTGGSHKKIATREERVLNQSQIARYFEAQLALLGDLCAGRAAGNVLTLQDRGGYQYSTLLAVARDERVAPSTRAAALRLVNNLYVDRWPHAPVEAPALLWVLQDVEAKALRLESPATAFPQPRLPATLAVPDGFAALRGEVAAYLERAATGINPENFERNALTESFVEVASRLQRYGYYHTDGLQGPAELARLLVALTNPTTDLHANHRAQGRRPLARAKAKALEGLSQISDAVQHWRVERVLAYPGTASESPRRKKPTASTDADLRRGAAPATDLSISPKRRCPSRLTFYEVGARASALIPTP